jgi:hypothetical protein
MLFFLFRSYITNRRRRIIARLRLLEKLEKGNPLSPEDIAALHYIVGSVYISKERWNYLVIFICSLGAIAWDLWFRFTH